MDMTDVTELKALESSIAARIQDSLETSADDTILGFIEVDEEAQKQILNALRWECLLGSIGSMLKTYPCLTTYGLSVAAPIGMKDEEVFSGGFYTAWESAFGYSPENGIRERLGLAFNRTVDGLGLPTGSISPDQPIHYKGGCYLFHSGILPHFVQPLRVALDQAIKRRPLPDPDDSPQCDAFAHMLAEIVHPAQARLRKVLHSPIGGFLVRRLVRWHLTGDDSLFPAHIQELLAGQKGKAVFANSPYLAFDEIRGEIQLVLPPQNSKLADANTRWTVPGMQPMRAAMARPPIDLADIETENGELIIRLSHLRGDLEAIDFKLRAGLSESTPFLIFETSRNREQRASFSGDVISLRQGQEYLIVLSSNVEVASQHPVEKIGEIRILRYAANPGIGVPVLRVGQRSWSLKPAIKAGLYLARDEASLLQVHSQTESKPVPVSYGQGFSLTCCFPSDTQPTQVVFSTPLNPKFTQTLPLPVGVVQGELRMVDLSKLLMAWTETLPPAILRIEVRVPLPTRTLMVDWIFWKGLKRLTIYGDLWLDSPPENLRKHPGFIKKGSGLDREERNGNGAELHLCGLGKFETERWSIPSNRVEVSLINEDGIVERLGIEERLDLVSGDKRVIQFKSGGLMPVRLIANGKEVGVVSPSNPVICRYPSALLAEAGKSATIRAETMLPVPSETPWPLISWQSPLTAKECRTPQTATATMSWIVRRISTSELAGVRVILRRVDQGFRGINESHTIEIAIPEENASENRQAPIEGIELILLRKVNGLKLQIDFERDTQIGAVWGVEVEGKLEDTGKWQTLMVSEKHGRLAQVSFLMIGAAPTDSSPVRDLFWSGVTDDLPADAPLRTLDSTALSHAISEASRLLEWKYPTSVWQQNAGRLKAVCSRVSDLASQSGDDGRSAWWHWAISSLSRHSREAQPVVIPEIPILHGFTIAAQRLKGCEISKIQSEGVVARSFAEVIRFDNRSGNGCLNFLQEALQFGRIDLDAISYFQGFSDLIAGKDIKLGSPKLRDWMGKMYETCKTKGLELEEEGALLSAGHFVQCLTKARRRCHVLNSVASAEEGHWLSGPIARLNHHLDGVKASIQELLGPMQQGAPVDIMWRPFEETPLLGDAGDSAPLIRALMPGNLLLALAMRKHAAGTLSWDEATKHMRKIVGGNVSKSMFHDQAGLLIATAPELFAFYFLLFTLAL